ncbi:signal peptide peptidase SppA [Amphritea sp. 1_MG-2023]|uniref:signal peptide peptidase SppA n=1 Tax=Amphritea sp. 1_MG-2023 TaxID=3062670 RepID=UPI0026E3A419|nr:signal peptide peptidase SppA [Amphritea sp. 1_MG-2023]MDO6563130.1 signal peptide peptidase SppA [Amphritea sp. 1_MG-2023]
MQPPEQNAKAEHKAKPEHKTKEWRLIERTMMGLQKEQRSARRWGIFFKLLTFGYLFVILGIYLFANVFTSDIDDSVDHTAVVQVKGMIADGEDASADKIIYSLRKAFADDSAKAVILRINSPGGSPVQSGYVYDEVKRLRALHPQKKVYAVILDIGASGAYYIAASADEIYADKASLVGSIGVVSSGFGFVDLMEKVGVERRNLIAGENKTFLDPFSPLEDKDRMFWQTVLNTTHQQFIEQVRQGRGDRLKENDQLFSGLVWTGEQALELGLIDGLGSSSSVARDIVGVEKLVDYSPKGTPLEQLIDRLGVSFGKTIATQLGLNNSVQLR